MNKKKIIETAISAASGRDARKNRERIWTGTGTIKGVNMGNKLQSVSKQRRAALAVTFCLAAGQISAQTVMSYDADRTGVPDQGGSATRNWNGPNWTTDNGASYTNWVDGSIARFNEGTAAQGVTMSNTAGKTLGGIIKDGTANSFTTLSGYGGTLTLADGAAIKLNNNSGSLLSLENGVLAGNNVVVAGTAANGRLRLGTGASTDTYANTLNGLTISNGTVTLQKADNVAAVNGAVTLAGGTLNLTNHNQFGAGSTLTQNGGVIAFGARTQTISELTIRSGTHTASAGSAVNLNGADALTLRNVDLNAGITVNLSSNGAQTVRFDAVSNSTASVGAMVFSGGIKTFNIENGNVSTDMIVKSNITESASSSLTKTGAGKLALWREVDISGDLLINEGSILLAGQSAFNFTIGANGVNNGVKGTGAAAFEGQFKFDLTQAGDTVGDSWLVVDATNLTETYGTSFSVNGFTDAGDGKWIKEQAGCRYEFDKGTGRLTTTGGKGRLRLTIIH
jgi:hypothetical protein